MSVSDLTIDGYRLDGLTWGVPESDPALNGHTGPMNGLELRDYGLDGGEIQIELTPNNRGPDDPRYWYAAKCQLNADMTNTPPATVLDAADAGRVDTQDDADDEDTLVIGVIRLKRMDRHDICVGERTLDLEELDNGHLLDRLAGEVLKWHAEDVGPGPWTTPRMARRRKMRG